MHLEKLRAGTRRQHEARAWSDEPAMAPARGSRLVPSCASRKWLACGTPSESNAGGGSLANNKVQQILGVQRCPSLQCVGPGRVPQHSKSTPTPSFVTTLFSPPPLPPQPSPLPGLWTGKTGINCCLSSRLCGRPFIFKPTRPRPTCRRFLYSEASGISGDSCPFLRSCGFHALSDTNDVFVTQANDCQQ